MQNRQTRSLDDFSARDIDRNHDWNHCVCQPHFVQDGPSVLEFKELRHPYVTPRYVVFNTPNRLFERGYRHGEGVSFWIFLYWKLKSRMVSTCFLNLELS
ncbi:hypothetical protein RhiirA5_441388 [Rhizophagus irregularis]|uniref:Uncharacterized protein n=1 Tax=Rhizophagus irregularis TaxID=588596 RepID=A0A2N0NFT6_9GLOM|nr:hypothetical protein RhiirA5_441388 [Rhizophagus irregularis]